MIDANCNDGKPMVLFPGANVAAASLVLVVCALVIGCASDHVKATIPSDPVPSAGVVLPTDNEGTPAAGNVVESPAQPPSLSSSVPPFSAILPSWFPPRMAQEKLQVEDPISCPLADVLHGARDRVDELIANMNSFTATEQLTHENLTKSGRVTSREKRKFDYIASITTLPSGEVSIDEFRNGDNGPNDFPDGISTQGLSALMFVLQRQYQRDYDFDCEGLTVWDDSPAWVLYFRQRSDRPRENLRYIVDNKSYDVAIEGRAWIAAGTFQILRMESDIVNPITKIRLNEEHEDIVYKPVTFKERSVTLWLPADAELYFYFRGHLYHRIQAFRAYRLFWVSATEKIGTVPLLKHP